MNQGNITKKAKGGVEKKRERAKAPQTEGAKWVKLYCLKQQYSTAS